MWLAGVTLAGLVLVVLAVVAAVLFLRQQAAWDFVRRDFVMFSVIALAWTGIAILSLVDLAHGSALWMSVTSFDHCVRVAFVGGVMRTGVVPANPLLWPGHAAPMHYYYFWYVTCAVIASWRTSVRARLLSPVACGLRLSWLLCWPCLDAT